MSHSVITRLLICILALLPVTVAASEIHEAVGSGDIARVGQLLEQDKMFANAANEQGTPPLILAVQNGSVEIAELLLGAGAEVDARDARGFTALLWAVFGNHRELTELLVDRGADVAVQHPALGSAVDLAFHMECQRGASGLTEYLINKGAAFDPDATGPRGLNRLRVAVMLGSIDMVRWLIEQGADVDMPSPKDGTTAITWAAYKGNLELIDALVAAGAGVDFADAQGAPPMKKAVERGHAQVVRRLIDAGARLDYCDDQSSMTLLHLAAIYGHRSIVQSLLDKNADIGARDKLGRTPLYYACRYGHVGLVDLLGSGERCGEERAETVGVLGDKLGQGEAVAWYLSNRGWVLRTAEHMLVFDAEEFGVTRPDESSLANGFLTPRELADQKVIALYTCYHGEEGEPAYIHELEDSLPGITYVHNQDDPWRGCRNSVYLSPYQTQEARGVSLHTITPITYMPSLAYLCEVDGMVIYYADVTTDDLDKFRADLDSLALYATKVDIAFLPADGFEAGTESDIELFLTKFHPRAVILTNSNANVETLAAARSLVSRLDPGAAVYSAEYPGDHAVFKGGRFTE